MKIRIAVLIALGTILPIQMCFSDTVDVTKMKTFGKGKTAVAAEVNGNFSETTRAINDNFAQIQSLGAIGGDGSSKILNIFNNRDWSGKNARGFTRSPTNFNWSNCTISGAITLTIPSGTTLRCKDGFTLSADATIVVKQGYGAGVAIEQPMQGALNIVGFGGIPAEEATIRSSTNAIPLGGAGRASGGYLRIQSDGVIDIQGTIIADGSLGVSGSRAGGGGGAGGIVVLQSTAEVRLSGTLQANGGKGADAKNVNGITSTVGPSGGGGGGIIVIQARTITVTSATINVQPGAIGGTPAATSTIISFGDGGYASGGRGGSGDNLANGSTPLPGGTGLVIQFEGNPATMVP